MSSRPTALANGSLAHGLALAMLLPSPGLSAEEPAEAVESPVESARAEQEQDRDEPARPGRWYRNIVPVPVVITEPAIGKGLGIGVGYFHPKKTVDSYQPHTIESADTVRDVSVARKPPPTVTGAFGAVTSNGTWAGGVGHMNSWRNDTIRYLGAAAYANIIADFYAFDRPFEFNLEGFIFFQDIKFRVAQSNWFLGAALLVLDGSNVFRLDLEDIEDPPDVPDGFLANDFIDVGLTGRVMYETRDDTIMPDRGRLFDLSVTRNDEALGGDYDYTTLKMKFLSFHPLHERFVLGLRAEYSMVEDDPPFYAIPWVSLRGIPALRYQGKQVVVAEAEGRFNFNENWAAVAFYGKGWVDNNLPATETEQNIRAHGVGARWRALKDQGVWVGLDFARGPEDDVYYIQVGHAW